VSKIKLKKESVTKVSCVEIIKLQIYMHVHIFGQFCHVDPVACSTLGSEQFPNLQNVPVKLFSVNGVKRLSFLLQGL